MSAFGMLMEYEKKVNKDIKCMYIKYLNMIFIYKCYKKIRKAG